MKKFVGKTSRDERDDILNLYKKKCSLEELLLVEDISPILKTKVKEDLNSIEKLYQQWWDTNAQKYDWEKSSGKTWTIDFETCDVFLDL